MHAVNIILFSLTLSIKCSVNEYAHAMHVSSRATTHKIPSVRVCACVFVCASILQIDRH